MQTASNYDHQYVNDNFSQLLNKAIFLTSAGAVSLPILEQASTLDTSIVLNHNPHELVKDNNSFHLYHLKIYAL